MASGSGTFLQSHVLELVLAAAELKVEPAEDEVLAVAELGVVLVQEVLVWVVALVWVVVLVWVELDRVDPC